MSWNNKEDIIVDLLGYRPYVLWSWFHAVCSLSVKW